MTSYFTLKASFELHHFLVLWLSFCQFWIYMSAAPVPFVRALWETFARFRLQSQRSVSKIFPWRRDDTPRQPPRQQAVGNHALPPDGPDGSVDCLQHDIWRLLLFAKSEVDLPPLIADPESDQPRRRVLRQKTSPAPFEESRAPEGRRGLVPRGSTRDWGDTWALWRRYEDAVSQRAHGGGSRLVG